MQRAPQHLWSRYVAIFCTQSFAFKRFLKIKTLSGRSKNERKLFYGNFISCHYAKSSTADFMTRSSLSEEGTCMPALSKFCLWTWFWKKNAFGQWHGHMLLWTSFPSLLQCFSQSCSMSLWVIQFLKQIHSSDSFKQIKVFHSLLS